MASSRKHLTAVSQQPGRVIIYRRVSALMGRKEDADDFHSAAMQLNSVRRHVTPLGLKEIGVVDDIDVTGRTFSREGLDTIRVKVETGGVDVIAVYDLSRLGRNAGEALRFIQWLREHNVTIISTVEKIDDSPEGQFILTQWLALAQLYSDQIGRRWHELIMRRAHEQGAAHGRPPLGYRKEGKRMVVDDQLAPAVTEVFQRYADGELINEITRWFAIHRGQRTERSRIKKMLANPQYLGKVVLNGAVVSGNHPPLVSQDLWDKVQQRLAADARMPARTLSPAYSLTGLVYCAHCERRATVSPTSKEKGVVVPRPLCRRMSSAAGTDAPICIGFGQPRLNAVEKVVLDKLRVYLGGLRADTDVQEQVAARAASATANVETMERRLNVIRDAIPRLASRWALQEITDDEYNSGLATLRDQERAVVEQLAELRVATEVRPPDVSATLIERMLNMWDRLDSGQRNRALRSVVSRIVIARGPRTEPLANRVTVVPL